MLMKELTGVGHYKRRLKPNAVPTVFQHKPTKLPRETTEVRSRKRQRQEMLDYLLGECKQTATADVAVGGDRSGNHGGRVLHSVNTAVRKCSVFSKNE